MIKILCVCGNGMGTSTILKLNVSKICTNNNIEAKIESCAFGEALTYLQGTDLVLTSPEWEKMLPKTKAVHAVAKNLVDIKTIEEVLLEAINTNFPEAIRK